jgi:hypothetical protein
MNLNLLTCHETIDPMSTAKKTRVLTAMVMPGGWHKPEVDRAGRQLREPIRADTFWDLIAAVTKFRADNLIPIGNVQHDVEEYICEKFPNSCVSRGATAVVEIRVAPPAVNPAQTLTDNMIGWMDKRLNNHSVDRIVIDSEARQRAEVCRKCPMNVKWNTGCGTCVDAVGRLSTALRLGKDVPGGKRLFACRVLQHENRSAVWLDKSLVETSPTLPGHCWAKR